MVVPVAGFAISLADGWDIVSGSDLGLFYMSRGVLYADDSAGSSLEGPGSSIGVFVLPVSVFESDPAFAADPIGRTVEELTPNLPGETTRSVVDLAAGAAVRLDSVVDGSRNATTWVVGGGFYGYGCESQEAVFVVMAAVDDPAELPILEQMAESLELLSRDQVLEAGCDPTPWTHDDD